MRIHPIPIHLTALMVDLHTTAAGRLTSAPATPFDVHTAIDNSRKGTTADKAWAGALLDNAGLTPQLTVRNPVEDLDLTVLAARGDVLRQRLRAVFSPAWPDLYGLTVDCTTMTAAHAQSILDYARTHRTAQRNALRALNRAPGLQTGPSITAIGVVIDALEHNPHLSPDHLSACSFGVLCDELATTGRALTIAHLISRRGTGRFKRGHHDALTAAYRTYRNSTPHNSRGVAS